MNINECFSQYHNEADACYNPQFFAKERVLRFIERVALEKEHAEMLMQFLDYADDELLRFMWQFYYFQFCTSEEFWRDPIVMEGLKMPLETEAKYPGCIRSVVYLLAVENLETWLDGKQVGYEENMNGYLTRYRGLSSLNKISHDTYGLCRLSYFLYASAKPFLLRVGRLNYQYREYLNYCEMYEDVDGNRIFVALPNYTYNARGLQEQGGFTPLYQRNDNILTAHIFRKDGTLASEPTTISLKDYSLVLKPGDPVITIHIPEGGPLLRDEVIESVHGAMRVFGEHFPMYKAVVCQTWFLDPALRGEVILDGSNMSAFADLFDVISGADNNNHSIYEHVFKVKRQPLENLVPMNAFSKRILDRALRGEKLYWGYGVIKKSVIDGFLKG